jgi:hypothetical protein
LIYYDHIFVYLEGEREGREEEKGRKKFII